MKKCNIKIKILPFICLLLCILPFSASEQWTVSHEYTQTLPSRIYQLNLNAADLLHVTLTWYTSTADLDLYLYQSGSNLLSSAIYLQRAYYSNRNPEVLTHTMTTAGTYYIRPDNYNTNSPVAFTLTILINGVLFQEFHDVLNRVNYGLVVKEINVVEEVCRMRVIYSGNQYPLYMYRPGVSVVDTGSAYQSVAADQSTNPFIVDIDGSGNWRMAIAHGITSSASVITPISYTIRIEVSTSSSCHSFCSLRTHAAFQFPNTTNRCICQDSYIWDPSQQECWIDCLGEPNVDATAYNASGIHFGINNTCQCEEGYQWGSNSTCELICDPNDSYYNSSSQTCWVLCGVYGNSSGETVGSEECECLQGFQWVNQGQGCIPACRPGEFWSDSAHSCWIDCGQQQDAQGADQAADVGCECKSGYEWSFDSRDCQSKPEGDEQSTIYIVIGVGCTALVVVAGVSLIVYQKMKKKRMMKTMDATNDDIHIHPQISIV